MWEKIKVWCKRSFTIFVSYVLVISGAIIEGLPYLADLLASTDVSNALHESIPQRWVGLYNIGVGIIVYAARMRTLKGT